MMEEYAKDYMSIGNVLSPILAPGIPGEMVGTSGKPSNESSALRLRFSFEGGLIPIVCVDVYRVLIVLI